MSKSRKLKWRKKSLRRGCAKSIVEKLTASDYRTMNMSMTVELLLCPRCQFSIKWSSRFRPSSTSASRSVSMVWKMQSNWQLTAIKGLSLSLRTKIIVTVICLDSFMAMLHRLCIKLLKIVKAMSYCEQICHLIARCKLKALLAKSQNLKI